MGNEIVLAIIGLVSVLLGGGTLAALFQIRNLNAKLMAETGKIKSDSSVNTFQAQIDAATKLSTSMASRLDTLTKRISEYEIEAEGRETRIEKLEADNERLEKAVVGISKLLERSLVAALSNLESRGGTGRTRSRDIILMDANLKISLEGIKKEYDAIKAELTLSQG